MLWLNAGVGIEPHTFWSTVKEILATEPAHSCLNLRCMMGKENNNPHLCFGLTRKWGSNLIPSDPQCILCSYCGPRLSGVT
jgi:hypothetical protein